MRACAHVRIRKAHAMRCGSPAGDGLCDRRMQRPRHLVRPREGPPNTEADCQGHAVARCVSVRPDLTAQLPG